MEKAEVLAGLDHHLVRFEIRNPAALALPEIRALIEVVKASNRPAAAIESTRNEIACGFGQIASAIKALPPSDQIN